MISVTSFRHSFPISSLCSLLLKNKTLASFQRRERKCSRGTTLIPAKRQALDQVQPIFLWITAIPCQDNGRLPALLLSLYTVYWTLFTDFRLRLREDFLPFRLTRLTPSPGSLTAMGVYSFPSSPFCLQRLCHKSGRRSTRSGKEDVQVAGQFIKVLEQL